MEESFITDLFKEVAGERGIAIIIEPAFGRVGEMVFPGGRRHLFKSCNPNINPSVSVEIARDKGYTHYFLRLRGIRTPGSAQFFAGAAGRDAGAAGSVDRAVAFADSVGYPVFVKPNNLGEGRMVHKAHDAAELRKWARSILNENDTGIVETFCPGNDYRVVVLDGRVVSAYQRIPLTVAGNGRDDVATLLAAKKRAFPSSGRPDSEIDLGDVRIDVRLARMERDRSYVPAAGEQVRLLDNANLSTGGTSVDLTDRVHDSFAELAARTGAALGLRLAGVDFMCGDIAAPAGGQEWNVIEVNGEPDLDNYASTGAEQEDRLRGIYEAILDGIGTGMPV